MVKHQRVPPQECPFASYAEEIRQEFQQDNEPDRAQGKQEAERFLQKLRPGGPWVLTAIVPDGATETITARTTEDVAAFIRKHDGKKNLYYSVNPTRTALNKKAAKIDIAAIEFALADLDPNEDENESSDAAKDRSLRQGRTTSIASFACRAPPTCPMPRCSIRAPRHDDSRDRATIVVAAFLQILADAERELDLDPRELKLRLKMHLREEFVDLTQQIAADRGGHDG
jgi:hypothetical protein